MNTHGPQLPPFPPGLEPPRPPAGLKEQILRAAGEAMVRPVPDRWTRLWGHPAARLAWAFAAALLMMGNLFLHTRGVGRGTEAGFESARAGRLGPELAELATLPRINTALLPFAAPAAGDRMPPIERSSPSGTADPKEKI